mgnify:CR=1 FL=1
MRTAEASATQFVKLMGEDVTEGMDFLQKVITHTRTDDILKEINWLGEAKEMGKRDIDKIDRYTDMNQHNDSVKHLASVMGLKKEEKIMEIFNEIISEIKKIDLSQKIESLESKISMNLDEKLYSELLSLRNQLKSG